MPNNLVVPPASTWTQATRAFTQRYNPMGNLVAAPGAFERWALARADKNLAKTRCAPSVNIFDILDTNASQGAYRAMVWGLGGAGAAGLFCSPVVRFSLLAGGLPVALVGTGAAVPHSPTMAGRLYAGFMRGGVVGALAGALTRPSAQAAAHPATYLEAAGRPASAPFATSGLPAAAASPSWPQCLADGAQAAAELAVFGLQQVLCLYSICLAGGLLLAAGLAGGLVGGAWGVLLGTKASLTGNGRFTEAAKVRGSLYAGRPAALPPGVPDAPSAHAAGLSSDPSAGPFGSLHTAPLVADAITTSPTSLSAHPGLTRRRSSSQGSGNGGDGGGVDEFHDAHETLTVRRRRRRPRTQLGNGKNDVESGSGLSSADD